MKAAIYKSYGSPEVMEIIDVEKPSIKDEDRVLIKVVSASVGTATLPLDRYILRRNSRTLAEIIVTIKSLSRDN